MHRSWQEDDNSSGVAEAMAVMNKQMARERYMQSRMKRETETAQLFKRALMMMRAAGMMFDSNVTIKSMRENDLSLEFTLSSGETVHVNHMDMIRYFDHEKGKPVIIKDIELQPVNSWDEMLAEVRKV